MVDSQTDIKAQVRVGGLGDLDGDERTLSKDVCRQISELAEQDLRERYTDIDDTDEIHVVCINAPNVAILKQSEGDE